MKTIIILFFLYFSCNDAAVLSKANSQCVADIALLVDESTSVTNLTFVQYVIPFLQKIANALYIEPTQTHVSMVKICSPADTGVAFDFNFLQTTNSIVDKLGQEVYCTGTDALAHALTLTSNVVFNENHGARPVGSSMYRVAVIITDGIATDGDSAAISALVKNLQQNLSVSMFAVGVGPILTHEYLLTLTGGNEKMIYTVQNYSALDQIAKKLIKDISCV